MKKIIGAALAAFVIASCNNGSSGNHSDKGIESYKKLFDKSIAMKDYHTAIMAAQMLLIKDSTLLSYQDSLPELYAATNNVEACAKTIDATLKRHPREEKFLQVKAIVQQEQGDFEGVFTTYTTLYETTQKLQYLYQLGTLHFTAGKLDEALQTVETILAKAANSKDSLDIFMSEQQKQKVPILAAALNFKGYIMAQKRNLPEAKKYFEAALKTYPDFVMARRNLQQLTGGGQRGQ